MMSQCRYSPLVNIPPAQYLPKKPSFFTITNSVEMIFPYPVTQKKGEQKPLLTDYKKTLPTDFKSITTKLRTIIDSFLLSEGTCIPFHDLHTLVKQSENLVSHHTHTDDNYVRSLKAIEMLETKFKNTQHLNKIIELTNKLKHQLSPTIHTLTHSLSTLGR